MPKCRCETCSSEPDPLYCEPHRHACESRYVADMETHEERRTYLAGVADRRGKAVADRLRVDAWELVKERG